MGMVIRIFLGLGVLGNIAYFTVKPFSKKVGLIIILMGIIAGLAEGFVIGLPMIGIGVLLLLIQLIYQRCC
ncbi:MAG: hypothetical protein AB1611_08730 [bacterium]